MEAGRNWKDRDTHPAGDVSHKIFPPSELLLHVNDKIQNLKKVVASNGKL